VTDFGIARAGTSDITETGSVMGTAQYLSPEQAQGRPVDERADLYAIGIVLYELLTGQVPFDAEQPVSVALKQVSELPVPPANLVPAIPPAIDAVVLHALEKEPDRRYQSADEFIAALETARAEPQQIPPAPVIVEEEHDRSRWWLWVLIALALIAIAVGLYLTLRPEQLTVPDVIDRESATASQILQNRGFEVDIVTVVNPDVERDHVAAQDPRPNTEAPEGSTVTITVSAGPGDAAVPSVEGMPQDEAEQTLKDAGFETRVERTYSDDVRNGRVIGTSPPAGTTLERGSQVTLNVSRGPEQVEVPDVTGESQENARSALEGAGLRVGKITREESGEAPGTVIEQSPAAGQQVDKGAAVDLTVAEPTAIPDVVDLTEEEAQAELEDAGFEVTVRDQAITDPAQEGIVLEQSPSAGEERRQGSRVTIIVGRAAPETPTPTPTTVP
jgi:serine/threonine-protein kinase